MMGTSSASGDLEAAAAAPRVGIKQRTWMQDAAARRRETMRQQRQARRDLTAHARRLAAGLEPDTDAEDGGTDKEPDAMTDVVVVGPARSKRRTREDRVKRRREHFARQLMVPEWLVDVPPDLNGRGSPTGGGWYVLPRPEGRRVLVTAANGVTIARTQSGSVIKKFPSALPSGSRKTAGGGGGENYCILDCIFHEHDATFYVLDVMCWKGYLLYNCTTEFRLYWLRDKLSEGTAGQVSSANPYRFVMPPCYECDEQGLQDAYATPVPFLKDGLLFYLKAAQYELGLTPLVLVWKDAMISRFFVYTEKPSIVLQLDDQSRFTTLEGIVLWQPDPSFVQQNELTQGDLAKFSFDEGLVNTDQEPHLHGLTFLGRCSPQRALADSWTKILFQNNARSGGVQITHLLEVARHLGGEDAMQM